MNNEIYTDQLLDSYLKGTISPDEVKKLLTEKKVEDSNEAMEMHHAAAVALQRNAVLTQVRKIHTDFVSSYKKSEANENNNSAASEIKTIRMHTLKWALRVAAVFILVVGGWFTYTYTTTSSVKLYAEIYEPYNLNTERNLVTDITPHNMVQEFKNKNYKAVITIYQSLQSTNNREKFLTAIAFHETGQYRNAINLFEQILAYNTQNNSRLYQDETEFFLALSYLKLKDNKAALSWFRKIYNDPAHTFHKKVSKWTITRLKWIQ